MGESSSSSSSWMLLANETQLGAASHLSPAGDFSSETLASSVEESIEKSKSHWSELREFDSDGQVSNLELFETLQRHPTWGCFFGRIYGLVLGEKFAEGGQAELYNATLLNRDPRSQEFVQTHSIEHVLKVFKKGTSLQHLQAQWPQGMLQHHVNKRNRAKLGLPPTIRFQSDVLGGTLLEDGRFAFLMVKEIEDLRSLINRHMLTCPKDKGPLTMHATVRVMYEVAYGMKKLHDQGIVHRDLKASNVLVSGDTSGDTVCCIADFESSVGVVGTGFFRAPEILKACKERSVSSKPGLFTQAADVYSYGMTCYEILTGKLPFEGHLGNNYDLVLGGQRPQVPEYVDDWIRKLLSRCWDSSPSSRPSFCEILKILQTHSLLCREWDSELREMEKCLGLRMGRKWILEPWRMWRLLQLKMLDLQMLR